MDTSLSMLIMGSVLIIIGIVKNLIPVKFNESIFGKIEGKAENYAAAMRTNIGASFIGMGIVLLLNRNTYDPNQSKALVFSIGIALSIFLISIILGYFRKFMDHIPVPPMVILGSLIIIAFSSTNKVKDFDKIDLDATKVDPKHYKVEFENDQVRMVRIKYGPNEKSVMHEHTPGAVVFLTDGEGKMTFPDGSQIDNRFEAGTVGWEPGGKHLPENTSDYSHELILVELKKK